jgi:hypothetical protein
MGWGHAYVGMTREPAVRDTYGMYTANWTYGTRVSVLNV